MLQPSDLDTLHERGSSEMQVMQQLQSFAKGFPFLHIISPAAPDQGIVVLAPNELDPYLVAWNNYLNTTASILKFVPASGAASRMFKDLFEYLESETTAPASVGVQQFFDRLNDFAFFDILNKSCLKNTGKDCRSLIENNRHKDIVDNLLSKKGLNYGALPKGLLQFHRYDDHHRTPVQEHLSEGAQYAQNKEQVVNIHFTVSTEHRALFEQHIMEVQPAFEKATGVSFRINFSEQKPSTDTIAADENNHPFRENGKLVFRPGGHGALIENLNDLDADIIFIKNIDNVVPDHLKEITITYKKVIAGILVSLQERSFAFLREMEEGQLPESRLWQIADFCEHALNNIHPGIAEMTPEELQIYLMQKVNRPIRVCGMVKNTGEPGGGPFLTVNADGTISPQILESSQINLSDPIEKQKMMQSTHFNPVDLVCGVKNYRGEAFDLLQFVDPQTGFISIKSKGGKELKALELPGLWNGAMADWNTIFVEVPVETFNPVKTVNDLLRPQHQ